MSYIIKTLGDIEHLERTSASCSDKYVPIKTSDFVKALTETFTLNSGMQYATRSTAHYVTMSHGDEATRVYIENSFDRTRSLRISFEHDGFIFGKIRQIHKGKPAEEIAAMTTEVKELYSNALQTIDILKRVQLTENEYKDIATAAFKARGITLNRITNISYTADNALDFITTMVHNIKAGNYEYKKKTKTGITESPLAEVTRQSLMVDINHKIWQKLQNICPELYI